MVRTRIRRSFWLAAMLLLTALVALLTSQPESSPGSPGFGAPAQRHDTSSPEGLPAQASVERTPTDPPGTSEWVVAVLGEDGSAIVGARIMAPTDAQVATTDARGHATIGPPLDTVFASASGYVPAVARRPAGAPLVVVHLRRGVTLRGLVADQDGAALPGVTVTLMVGGSGQAPSPTNDHGVHNFGLTSEGHAVFACRTSSGPDGRYVIDAIPPGQHLLRAECKSHVQSADAGHGPLDTAPIKVHDDDVLCNVRMRRIYVGGISIPPPAEWPGQSAKCLFTTAFRAPDGMTRLSAGQWPHLLSQVAESARRADVPTYYFACIANDGSGLAEQVEAAVMVTTWPRDRRSAAFTMLPADKFSPQNVVFLEHGALPTPAKLTVTAPVRPTLLSIEPRGFAFDPVSSNGEHHSFLLPNGRYTLLPKPSALVGKNRSQECIVQPGSANNFTATAFDGLGSLRVRPFDVAGRPYYDCSIVVQGTPTGTPEAILSARHGDLAAIPCEPGNYNLTLRNASMACVGSLAVSIQPGKTTECELRQQQ